MINRTDFVRPRIERKFGWLQVTGPGEGRGGRSGMRQKCGRPGGTTPGFSHRSFGASAARRHNYCCTVTGGGGRRLDQSRPCAPALPLYTPLPIPEAQENHTKNTSAHIKTHTRANRKAPPHVRTVLRLFANSRVTAGGSNCVRCMAASHSRKVTFGRDGFARNCPTVSAPWVPINCCDQRG